MIAYVKNKIRIFVAQMYRNLKNISVYIKLFLVCVSITLLFLGCSPVKYVKKNEYLINKTEIVIDKSDINKGDIYKNVVQKPNSRILKFFRFHLGLYNLSGTDITKWYNRWLRTIGEEPVIYNEQLTERSVKQIKQYLFNNGYFDAKVKDTIVKLRPRRIKQIFKIKLGKPYLIDDFSYFKLDTNLTKDANSLRKEIEKDSLNSKIKVNDPLKVTLIRSERERITNMLKNKGYFNFSDRFLHFYADSSFKSKRIKLFMSLKKDITREKLVFRKYRIRNIYVKLISHKSRFNEIVDSSLIKRDTILYDNKFFIYEGKKYLRTKVTNSVIRINTKDLYSIDAVEKTYKSLQSLNQFKFINISFKDKEEVGENKEKQIDCTIELRPSISQSYTVSADFTNSSGNLGTDAKITYSHKNLFRGAENFHISVAGGVEREKVSSNETYINFRFGTELKLFTPKLFIPFFSLEKFRKKYSPKTVFKLGYNYQDIYYFKRNIVDLSFGYTWNVGKKENYIFNPLNIDFIDMINVNETFLKNLKNDYIKNSYISHMVMSSSIGYKYSDNTEEDFSNYFRLYFESAGNFASAIAKLTKEKVHEEKANDGSVDEFRKLIDIRYAQYLKTDLEYIFHMKLNKVSSLAGRFSIGIGYPYGNLKVLPYEKMYFAGGANGIRAWQVRTLGPGGTNLDNIKASLISTAKADGTYTNQFQSALDSYIQRMSVNRVSDMKIEANLEYRFKLFGGLEGAFFVDAGNIWSINEKEDIEESKFKIKEFYKQIAVGTGLGLRYDFNFFILRFDTGIKVVDPQRDAGDRFVFLRKGYNNFDDFTFNIAIGYPF